MLQFIDAFSSPWFTGMSGPAVKVAVLLAATALFVRFTPRLSAAVKHMVWLCAMLAGLAVPLLSVYLPTWKTVPAEIHPATIYEQVVPLAVVEEAEPAAVERPAALPTGATVSTPPDTTRSMPSAAAVVFALWAAGVLVVGIRFALAIVRLNRTVRETAPAQGEAWLHLLDDCRKHMGVNHPVQLRFHPQEIMPAVCGTVRPMILLPVSADRWPFERKRAVLLHELAHVARWDVVTQHVTHLACVVHWFNPLMWVARRESIRARERACDDMVLQTGFGADDYARDVLHVAASFSGRQSVAMGFARPSDLESRLVAIVKRGVDRRRLSTRRGLAVAAMALAAVVPLSVLAFSVDADAEPPAEVAYYQQDVDVEAEAERLIEALQDPDTRDEAIEEIESLGRDSVVVRRVVARLYKDHHSDEEVFRRYSNIGIAKAKNKEVEAGLIGALSDEYAVNRAAAARALGSVGGPDSVEPLIGVLSDENAHVREWAARALGDIRDPRAVAPLIGTLDDPNAHVREWSVRALGDIRDEGALDALIGKLSDTNAHVREWTCRSLAEIGDDRAIEPLIGMLSDDNAHVREWAVRGLGEIGDDRAIEPLMGRLGDPNPHVRGWAARALAELDYGTE